MPHEELGPILEALHKSLSDKVPLDDQDVVRLRAIIDEIQGVLRPITGQEESGGEAEDAIAKSRSDAMSGMKSRLNGLISEFELQHPQITNSLAAIAERLSDMGI